VALTTPRTLSAMSTDATAFCVAVTVPLPTGQRPRDDSDRVAAANRHVIEIDDIAVTLSKSMAVPPGSKSLPRSSRARRRS
jgi:hypothetical protein